MSRELGLVTAEEGRRLLLRAVSESDLQAQLLHVADLAGRLAFHDEDVRRCPHCGHATPDGRRRGFPDLVIAVPPVLHLWELKRQDGRVRPEQERWLAELARCTQIESGVVRPSDLDRALEQLTACHR